MSHPKSVVRSPNGWGIPGSLGYTEKQQIGLAIQYQLRSNASSPEEARRLVEQLRQRALAATDAIWDN